MLTSDLVRTAMPSGRTRLPVTRVGFSLADQLALTDQDSIPSRGPASADHGADGGAVFVWGSGDSGQLGIGTLSIGSDYCMRASLSLSAPQVQAVEVTFFPS